MTGLAPLVVEGERSFGPCMKCGGTEVHLAWHRGDWYGKHPACLWGDVAQRKSEHLHLYCQRCIFDWAEDVEPQPVKP